MTGSPSTGFDAYSTLAEADWSFTSRATPHPIESLHPYPAKFIGAIPAMLIRSLPVTEGTAVLDPFCGSGSTLVEAQRAGLPSVGIDLNPIACLISRVKTGPYPKDLVATGDQILDIARRETYPEIPDLPNLDHWFAKSAQFAIAALLNAIDRQSTDASADALRLALSRILVRVSRQESDTRYAAVDRLVVEEDVFRAYERSLIEIDRSLASRSWRLEPCTVLRADVLQVGRCDIGQLPISLVVTSPPYPNAYEYWLYHKYRMWWLGFDPIAVKAQEIGARAHFFGGNRHTSDTFRQQMASTFSLIDEVLIPGGHACFVVGRSKIHGQIVDNANTLNELATAIGYIQAVDVERSIDSKRKSFNLSHANIRKESVLVFRKPS